MLDHILDGLEEHVKDILTFLKDDLKEDIKTLKADMENVERNKQTSRLSR